MQPHTESSLLYTLHFNAKSPYWGRHSNHKRLVVYISFAGIDSVPRAIGFTLA